MATPQEIPSVWVRSIWPPTGDKPARAGKGDEITGDLYAPLAGKPRAATLQIKARGDTKRGTKDLQKPRTTKTPTKGPHPNEMRANQRKTRKGGEGPKKTQKAKNIELEARFGDITNQTKSQPDLKHLHSEGSFFGKLPRWNGREGNSHKKKFQSKG